MSDQGTELFQDSTSQSADKLEAGQPKADVTDKSQEALATLVGEGRKYKTADDLAKAYVNADAHIAQLTSENAKLREEAAKGKTINDVLERIESNRKQAGDTTPVASKGVTAEDLVRLVDERIAGRATALERAANIQKVEGLLKEQFGDKAKEVYLAKANSPEMRKALNNLAAVDPAMVMALFKTETTVGNPVDGSNRSGERSNVQTPTGRAGDPDCKEYFDVMRKKDPRKFYSTAVQLEMHRKLTSNPEKFLGRKV